MIFLIVGGYKSGKSVSAATFPKPMRFIDTDDGFLSILTTKKKDGTLFIPDAKEIDVLKLTKGGAHDLSFKTDLKGSSAPDYTKESINLINTYNSEMKTLSVNPKNYKTLVIDSLTNMFRLWKECILAINNRAHLQIADYNTLDQVLQNQFLPTLKALPIPYIVLIDHEDYDKDELTGAIQEFPIGPSRSQGKLMGLHFDEIYRQMVEGDKYLWYTRKKGLFNAGSRLNVPSPIEANYAALKPYLPTT